MRVLCQFRAVTAGSAVAMVTNHQLDTTQCDNKDSSSNTVAIGAAVGSIAVGGILYYGFLMEGADLQRVPLSSEDTAMYLKLLTNVGSANPRKELNHIRQQFGMVSRKIFTTPIWQKQPPRAMFATIFLRDFDLSSVLTPHLVRLPPAR